MFNNFKQVIKVVSAVSIYVVIAGILVMGFFFPENIQILLNAIAGFLNQVGGDVVKAMPFIDKYGLGIVITVFGWIVVLLFGSSVFFHIITHNYVNMVKALNELKNDSQSSTKKKRNNKKS